MFVDKLVLEIGRQCNLKCRHCLRGDSQNLAMPIDTAKKILKIVDSIGSITFSGGEPALYGKEIAEIVDFIVDENIKICDFYVASNGVIYNPILMGALVKLYAYIRGGELTSFDISTDKFHEESFYEIYPVTQSRYDFRLKAYSFVNNRGDINPAAVLREGNAEKNNLGTRILDKTSKFELSCEETELSFSLEEIELETLYVSAKGQLSPLCDFSYETLDSLDLPNINNINDSETLLTSLYKYNEKKY